MFRTIVFHQNCLSTSYICFLYEYSFYQSIIIEQPINSYHLVHNVLRRTEIESKLVTECYINKSVYHEHSPSPHALPLPYTPAPPPPPITSRRISQLPSLSYRASSSDLLALALHVVYRNVPDHLKCTFRSSHVSSIFFSLKVVPTLTFTCHGDIQDDQAHAHAYCCCTRQWAVMPNCHKIVVV